MRHTMQEWWRGYLQKPPLENGILYGRPPKFAVSPIVESSPLPWRYVVLSTLNWTKLIISLNFQAMQTSFTSYPLLVKEMVYFIWKSQKLMLKLVLVIIKRGKGTLKINGNLKKNLVIFIIFALDFSVAAVN